jgi:hypothetical protein
MAKQAFAREAIRSSFHRSTAKLKLLTMNVRNEIYLRGLGYEDDN